MFRSLMEMDEVKQILISVIAISFAFTLVFAELSGLFEFPKEFFIFMLLSIVTVGSGFILHEMSHKIVAIYYGAYARFRMWTQGLIFMLIVSLFGVLFAAPGAVYIYSRTITRRENGIISIAGPLMNIFLMVFFLALHYSGLTEPLYFPFPFIPKIDVWWFGAQINLMLGLFNMIPAFPLDGSKVIMWSKPIWVVTTLIMLGIGSILFSPILVIAWGVLLLIALFFSKMVFG